MILMTDEVLGFGNIESIIKTVVPYQPEIDLTISIKSIKIVSLFKTTIVHEVSNL